MASTTIQGLDAAALQAMQMNDLSMSGKTETSFRFQLNTETLGTVDRLEGKTKTLTETYEKENGIDPSIKEKITCKGNTRDDTEVSKDSGQVEEMITDAAEQLKEKLADKLGITVEEVEDAMETMGLTLMQLFDPEELSKLFLYLEGAEGVELLTDDVLYKEVQDILETLDTTMEELAEELDIPLEDLEMAFAKITGDTDIIQESKMTEFEDPKEVKADVEEVEVKEVSIFDQTDFREIEKEPQKATGQNEKQENPQQQSQTKLPEKELELTEKNVDHEHHVMTQPAVEGNISQEVPVTNTGIQIPESYLTEQTQSIMEQMVESMKAEVTPEVTELKLLLHPESLGSVNVTLTAKEGMVAAQFTAQNENVKNVLETQMIQLKETLEEKGIQVSEVQVTVESGAFNRQYSDQKHGEEAETAFEKEVKRHRTRQINLFEEGDEELDEADELTAKIMKENGNTLDYMA